MNDDNKKEIEVPIQHPLEEVFDIEEGTTMVPKTIIQSDNTTRYYNSHLIYRIHTAGKKWVSL